MTRGPVQPVTPEALAGLLADQISPRAGLVRVAIDGPPCSAPELVAEAVREPLRVAGRQAVHVRADQFWRDASLRFEHGREDADAYLDWLDAGALRREVLDRAAANRTYLPSMRDPQTNRSRRAQPQLLDEDAVVIVSGAFLLGLGLPFDLVVHLAVSPAARARRTPVPEHWTLAAFDRYDVEVNPAEFADLVVRWDDPRRPAVVGLT
jgi:uridine kinase